MTIRTTRRPQPLEGTYSALCKRKAGREAIFAELRSLAAEYGATVKRKAPLTPFEIVLELVAGPYGVYTVLDGRSRSGVFVWHWYIEDPDSLATYPRDFEQVADSVHPLRHVATTSAQYFGEAKLALRGGLSLLTAEMQKVA